MRFIAQDRREQRIGLVSGQDFDAVSTRAEAGVNETLIFRYLSSKGEVVLERVRVADRLWLKGISSSMGADSGATAPARIFPGPARQ